MNLVPVAYKSIRLTVVEHSFDNLDLLVLPRGCDNCTKIRG